MKALFNKSRKNGFVYTQVCLGQNACIYRQQVSPQISYFEVFRIKVRKERIIQFKGVEKKIDAGEIWPSNEAFGRWAWTYRTLDKAMIKYNELEKTQ
jgi:hypothetical protein